MRKDLKDLFWCQKPQWWEDGAKSEDFCTTGSGWPDDRIMGWLLPQRLYKVGHSAVWNWTHKVDSEATHFVKFWLAALQILSGLWSPMCNICTLCAALRRCKTLSLNSPLPCPVARHRLLYGFVEMDTKVLIHANRIQGSIHVSNNSYLSILYAHIH